MGLDRRDSEGDVDLEPHAPDPVRAAWNRLRQFPNKRGFLVLAALVALIVAGAATATNALAPRAAAPASATGATSASSEDGASTDEPMTPGEMMLGLYQHILPHPYTDEAWFTIGGFSFQPNNHHLAFLVAATLVFLLFAGLALRRKANLAPRGGMQNCLEALVLFVRNQMVYPIMGKEVGDRFLPLFLTQFFLILFMNLFGILPGIWGLSNTVHFPTTATANMSVTGGMALITFLTILGAGIKEQGFGKFVVHLAPSLDLGPGTANKVMKNLVLMILYPIEILGLLIKPGALMIRLFANMTGGHMALLTIYGLIFVAGAALPGVVTYPIAIVAVLVNVFLTFLEILVAFLQAYVFAFLSIIFIQAAVHPDH